ncbi:SIMPL domain-containing protein [Allopontixanthobacter sp.]|uniref:SIMPL domain-containing protein n=1 Tax=Allopontixanthobacter sp. TaxID=2906452 RepID=UPI002ABA8794|nr:SIMPL domain-containing protein [Allopontixanthobacter sp.]MDZ4308717.1 SIMPL domain-containing protein [Allopontixanthobacter sp.]
MKNFLIPALMLGAAAIPASAAEVQIQATGPVVELSVNETVKAKPDLATISAGVSTEAPTAVAAMRQNASEMDAVIKRIKSLGIADRDIQTSGINLNPRYDYDQPTQRQVFRGYSASNRVSVILRKVPDTGKVLDALVEAGATDIGGPQFSIDDDTAAKAQARKAAMERAQAQALEYANWAGYTGVRLLEVSESIMFSPPMPMMEQAIMVTGSRVKTPVEPGMVGTGVNLTVKYEMTR